jgi:hypothetical protein
LDNGVKSLLKQFAENPNNYGVDIEVAKQMRKVIENYENNNPN